MLSQSDRQIIAEMKEFRTIPEQLRHWVELRPSSVFCGVDDEQMTFADVDDRSARLATGLAERGIGKGMRVAIVMGNRLEFIVAFFALARLGAIATPINVYLKGAFLSHQLSDCGASAAIADAPGVEAITQMAGSLPRIRFIVTVDQVIDEGAGIEVLQLADLMATRQRKRENPVEPGDTMSILYTSGTTGMPKGCVLSHGYYTGVQQSWFEKEWALPSDVIYSPIPLYHAAGNLILLMLALKSGACVKFASEFSASRFMSDARSAGATLVWGVGAMGAAILASPPRDDDAQEGLRLAIWVPMAPTLQDQFEERFNVPVLSEGIGQTEVSPITLVSRAERKRRGSLGLPLSTLDVRLLDADGLEVEPGTVGEICVLPREPHVMFSGYWDMETEQPVPMNEEFHRTGDFAFEDASGELVFMDRKADAIRRRGVNVSSFQIEQALAALPEVSAIAVHAVDAELGDDDIKACVVLAEGVDLGPEEFFALCQRELPYYAMPKYVSLLAELPINAFGRVMKAELRKKSADYDWDFDALGLRVLRKDRRS